MCIVKMHDKDITFFPNFPSTKQGHEIKESDDQDFFGGSSEKSRLIDWVVLAVGF